jgi:hypothetical protein
LGSSFISLIYQLLPLCQFSYVEQLRFRLFSPTVKPSYHHTCQIDLLDPEKRWGFFHFEHRDGTFSKMPEVIERNGK